MMTYDELLESAKRHQTLSLLVHANSKIGKTTLAATCPKPLLLLDAEGGSKFLDHPKVVWDPLTGPPPAWDGTWEICTVVVQRFDTMAMVYQWLVSGQHHFRSLAIDSITEVQRRCKATLSPEDMRTQDWGALLVRMETLVRDFRDLTMHPTNPLSVALFVAETRQDGNSGQWRPYMQGQMGTSFPYLVDVIGYLFVQDVLADDQVTLTPQRQLLVAPHPQFLAGERVQGRLQSVVPNPDIAVMLETVYPQATQTITEGIST
jgi:hypothetical protein